MHSKLELVFSYPKKKDLIMEETPKEKDKVEYSAEYLQKVIDIACRDLEHRRNVDEAYKEAKWAAAELRKLGITPI